MITNAKRRAFKAVTALGAFGSITEEFSENQDAAAAVCDAADRVAEPQPEGTSTDEKDSTSGESKMEILGTLVGTPGFDVTDCTVVDNSQEAVFKALATCDYAVFSITEGPGQVVEALVTHPLDTYIPPTTQIIFISLFCEGDLVHICRPDGFDDLPNFRTNKNRHQTLLCILPVRSLKNDRVL